MDLKSRKPKKSEDWISIATKVKQVVDWNGSPEAAAQRYDVSPELIRSILRLLKLPPEVQVMVRNRKLGLDTASKLTQLNDPKRELEVSKLIESLPQSQQRQAISYAKHAPNSDLVRFIKRLTAEPKTDRLHVAAVVLTESQFQKAESIRKDRGVSLESLLAKIVIDWIERETK